MSSPARARRTRRRSRAFWTRSVSRQPPDNRGVAPAAPAPEPSCCQLLVERPRFGRVARAAASALPRRPRDVVEGHRLRLDLLGYRLLRDRELEQLLRRAGDLRIELLTVRLRCSRPFLEQRLQGARLG